MGAGLGELHAPRVTVHAAAAGSTPVCNTAGGGRYPALVAFTA